MKGDEGMTNESIYYVIGLTLGGIIGFNLGRL